MAWKGARAKKSVDQTADYSSPVVMTFDTDVIDTDAWHDTSSNTSRMTVPSGVTAVKLSAAVRFTNLTSNLTTTLRFLKNGSPLTAGVTQLDTIDVGNPVKQIHSYIDVCVAGDYYEFEVDADDNSVTIEEEGTWFQIEEVVVPPVAAYSGAVVKKSADQTAANYTTATAVAFDTEVHDVGGWHEGVTNPSRMTVPSGVSRIKMTFQVGVSSVDANSFIIIIFAKNGSDMTPDWWSYRKTVNSTNQSNMSVVSFVDNCTPGDYYQVKFWCAADASLTIIADETWFAIQKIE